jgi:hypothetical protein
MATTVLASGGYLTGVTDLAVDASGDVLLCVPGVGIVRVLPGTGGQSVLAPLSTTGDGTPSGIVIGPDGTVYVSMQGALPRVVQLSSDGAFLRVVTSGGFLPAPAGMCFGSDGSLYVCATAPSGGGGLVRVDLTSGAQTVIASGSPLVGPFDVSLAPDGSLWSVQFGARAQRQAACVVRTRVSDGYSEVVSAFACTAYGIAIRSDSTAVVGDCARINGDCGGDTYLYAQAYPSGSVTWGYAGPVAVVPDIVVQAKASSWGRVKVLYR